MATRRIGDATFDHGAQFFTVRGDAFGAQVAAWEAEGVARVWCHGFTPEGDGYPRYIGTRGMNSIAKHMAVGLDVQCRALTFAIRRAGGGSTRVGSRRRRRHGSSCGCGGFDVPARHRRSRCCSRPASTSRANWWPTTTTARSPSSPCSTAPSAVPPPGGVQLTEGTFSFVADNAAKGISAVPAVTLHAEPGWSEQHWDDDRAAVHDALVEAARPWFGSARARRQPGEALAVRDAAKAVARPVLGRAGGIAGRRRRRVRRTQDRGCLQLGVGRGDGAREPRDSRAFDTPVTTIVARCPGIDSLR